MDVLPKKPLRTRILPGRTLPPEEIAKRRAAREEFGARCRVVFEKLRPQSIDQYYNWFIAVGPDSEEYLIAPSLEALIEKGRESESDSEGKRAIFRLNETGTCGKI